MNKLGLVTVLFKSDQVLEDFIRSIAIQTFTDYFLYLVDNSAYEDTHRLVNHLCGEYRVTNYLHIKNDGNKGVAEGNNIGILAALEQGCSQVIILNNDIVFNDVSFFSDLTSYADTSSGHIFAPKIFFHQSDLLWYAGGYMLNYQLDIRQRGYLKKDSGQYNEPVETGYAPTCFVLVKSEVFRAIGLMDTKYFVYVDDTDFMYRAQRAGLKIVYYPYHYLFHKVGISTGGLVSDFYIYYNTRNRIYFARKHLPFRIKLTGIAYVFVSMIVKSVIRKNMKISKRLFDAFVDGFSMSINPTSPL